MDDFIELIKKLRTDKGLSTRELAEDIGVSQSYLSHLENGRRNNPPSIEVIKKMARALEYDSFDLMLLAGLMEEEEAREGRERLIQAQHDFSNLYGYNLIDILIDERPVFYNGHKLSEEDRQRILNVLKELFPQYQDKKE